MTQVLLHIALSAALFTPGATQVGGQKKADSPAKSAPSEEGKEKVESKGEVERLLAELKERGEIVIGICPENEPCGESLKKQTADAQTVSAEVTGGEIVEKPQPTYPLVAKAARASGVVTVLLVVDEQGRVAAAQAESGHPLLRAATVNAARTVRFKPFLLNGKPVKIYGAITYTFVLQ